MARRRTAADRLETVKALGLFVRAVLIELEPILVFSIFLRLVFSWG